MALSDAQLSAAEQNLATQLAKPNQDLLLKELETPTGGKKTYRDFRDIASLLTITRNQQRQNERDSGGIISLAVFED